MNILVFNDIYGFVQLVKCLIDDSMLAQHLRFFFVVFDFHEPEYEMSLQYIVNQ